jgi:hypothetical protein
LAFQRAFEANPEAVADSELGVDLAIAFVFGSGRGITFEPVCFAVETRGESELAAVALASYCFARFDGYDIAMVISAIDCFADLWVFRRHLVEKLKKK